MRLTGAGGGGRQECLLPLRVASLPVPPGRPPRVHPAPYSQVPVPNLQVPSHPAPPGSHLDAPDPSSNSRPSATPCPPYGCRTPDSAPRPASREASGRGEDGALGAASSTCRGRRVVAAARKRQRLFRRRLHRARLAPPAAPVGPDAPSPPPAPSLCLLPGKGGGGSSPRGLPGRGNLPQLPQA